MALRRIAFVHGVPLGSGGLGVQAGNAVRALAREHEVHVLGPGKVENWSAPPGVVWHSAPQTLRRLGRVRVIRKYAGLLQLLADGEVGRFAAHRLDDIKPDLCYGFTQVAHETLRWARRAGVPGVLESPNGHIRAFRRVYTDETRKWSCGRYPGHPNASMVSRVEREYALATQVRVSSNWSRQSLIDGGIAADAITTIEQSVDLERFAPSGRPPASARGLRICFVGSVDLRKGFVYLLRAMRQLSTPVSLEVVGGTGDQCSRLLLDKERQGLDVNIAPGDPRDALARADVFVLPTLEDGSPFAVAEAMASGVPVITTTATGAAEWIQHGTTGWVAEAASVDSLVAALTAATTARERLPEMGRLARVATEARVAGSDDAVCEWIKTL